MMKQAMLMFILIFTNSMGFMQNGFSIVHHRIEAQNINHEWVDARLENTFYNRTTRTFGAVFEVHKDMKTLTVVLQAFKFSDNTYKKLAPLRFGINGCSALRSNDFGINTLITTNGNLTHCPLKKGFYYIKDYVPPAKSFPPLIPFGTYKAEVYISTNKIDVITIGWYGSIVKNEKSK